MGLKRFFQSIQRDFDDIERLVKAFPSELENDVRAVAANLPFEDRNFRLANGTVQKHDFLVTEYKPDDLVVGNETVQLPYRVYLRESTEDQVKALTPLQRSILDCIYLRHNDGYIRQKHLERLSGQTEFLSVPSQCGCLANMSLKFFSCWNG